MCLGFCLYGSSLNGKAASIILDIGVETGYVGGIGCDFFALIAAEHIVVKVVGEGFALFLVYCKCMSLL